MGWWNESIALGNDYAADEILIMSKENFKDRAKFFFDKYLNGVKKGEDEEVLRSLGYFYACLVALSTGREYINVEICLGTIGFNALQAYRVVYGLDASDLYKNAKVIISSELKEKDSNSRVAVNLNKCLKALDEGFCAEGIRNCDIDKSVSDKKIILLEDFKSGEACEDIANNVGLWRELCLSNGSEGKGDSGYIFLQDKELKWNMFKGVPDIVEKIFKRYASKNLNGYKSIHDCASGVCFFDDGTCFVLRFLFSSEKGSEIDIRLDKNSFASNKVRVVENSSGVGTEDFSMLLPLFKKLIGIIYSRFPEVEFEEIYIFPDTNAYASGVGNSCADVFDSITDPDDRKYNTWKFGDNKPHCRYIVALRR